MREISDDRLMSEALETLVSATSLGELHLLAVNSMAALIGAEQSVLWVRGAFGKPKVVAISGLSSVERNIDFTHWFESAAQIYAAHTGAAVEVVPDEFDNPRLQSERSLYLLEDALHARIIASDGQVSGGLFVSRSELFTGEEIAKIGRAHV